MVVRQILATVMVVVMVMIVVAVMGWSYHAEGGGESVE